MDRLPSIPTGRTYSLRWPQGVGYQQLDREEEDCSDFPVDPRIATG